MPRQRPPDLWQFSLDAREVILERTSRAIKGQLSATEARRMILEKQSAAIRAQIACIEALFKGDPRSASHRLFNVYNLAVQSNRKRLRRKR
jgi:hypothetical protein